MYKPLKSKLIFSVFFLLLIFSFSTYASNDVEGFFRFPDVNNNLVVFTSEGDLWIADIDEGGDARRLTRDDGIERYARISPDGKLIAFTAEYDGNTDVYVMPVTGGEPQRLTFHGARDEVVGWSKDGKNILFRSTRFQPVGRYNIYSVSPKGGYPEDIGLDKATRISFDQNSDNFVYNRLRREERPWKRYKGGWAMDIWSGNLKTNTFKIITDFDGTDSYPMWIGNKVYFISDRSGRFNIFSMNPDGSDVKQHTFDEVWDIRWPSTDGKSIVYQKEMNIWIYDIATGKTRQLDIHLPTDRFRARDRIVKNPTNYIDGISIPNSGKRIAVTARGEAFTFPVDKKGYIRQLTNTPEARENWIAYSPDGKQIAVMSDQTDAMEIWIYPSNGGEGKQLTKGGKVWRFPMFWSPDGKYLLFADKETKLWVVDAKSGKMTMVDDAPDNEITNCTWAPDSKWVSWIRPEDGTDRDIWFYNIETKEKFNLDRPMTLETDMYFSPDGKYMYFVSENYFNPDLGDLNTSSFVFGPSSKIYALALGMDDGNPFAPELVEAFEEENEEDKESKDEDKDSEKEDEGVKVTIDKDGLNYRVYPVDIDALNYYGLVCTEKHIYFLGREFHGMMPEKEYPRGGTLYVYNIEDEKLEEVGSEVYGILPSADSKKLLIIKKGQYIVMDAGSTSIPDEDGVVDMSGWTLQIDPQAEWKQIMRDVWRLQRDFFYDPEMHGVDWPAIWKQYSSLLPRVSNRDELNDIIMEMIGELNIGHAYIYGGDIRHGEFTGTGYLGADFERTSQGSYKVTSILHGSGYGDEPLSPLTAAKNGPKKGDYILAVNGNKLTADKNIFEYLVDTANKEVLLTVNSTDSFKDSREIVVEPLRSEYWLRYLDWVRDRREYVDKASNGRIAYVHLPDMMTGGLTMWGRMYNNQYDKDALIVDVRHNGGGFVAQMILGKLERTLWSQGKGRETGIFRTPDDAFYGPMAAICNHETGSDGETFSEGWKRLGLGELFGTRTWGGWVGIRGGKPLLDRGGNTQPEFSGWGALDGKWLIEGPGVDPTIEVLDDPAKILKGEDPQLDATIKHLLKELETYPKLAAPPAFPKKPLKIQHQK